MKNSFCFVSILVLAFLFSCKKEDESTTTPVNTPPDVENGKWTELSSGTNMPLNAIFFINENIGWAVGLQGTIVHTTDGGSTWLDQSITDSNISFSEIKFTSESNGFLVGIDYQNEESFLYTTSNGGNSWVSTKIPDIYEVYDLYFSSTTNGLVVGGNDMLCTCALGQVSYTTDGGNTWTESTFLNTDGDPYKSVDGVFLSVDFIDESTGWLSGEYGNIFKTTDGGKTWQTEGPFNGGQLEAIDAISASNIFVVGDKNLIAQSENGDEFETLTKTDWNNNNGVAFANDNEGWVVSHAVNTPTPIFYTSDGGKNWKKQDSDVSEDLHDVFFINNTTGWAVGKEGVITKYTAN